ncbi:MAG: hypothetical protein ACR2NR_08910 [Solirubrobacteraceae bacterium]
MRARLGSRAAQDVHARFAPGRLLGAVQPLYDSVLAHRGARGDG